MSAIAKGSLTARQTRRAGAKAGYSDPVVLHGRAIAHRIKVTIGITGLSPPRVHIDGEVWHLDVGSSHPGAVVRSKGWAVRPLKRHASWVQNVVRQFGPYPVSGMRARDLNGVFLSTRGPGRGNLQCTGYPAKGKRPVAVFQADKC